MGRLSMALVGNGVRTNQNPMRQMGGPLAGVVHRAQWGMHGALRNFWAGEATGPDAYKGAFPSGYLHPYTWALPPTAGGIASRFEIAGSGSVDTASLAGGLNATADLSGAGTLAADLGALAGLVAALAGVGSASADIAGVIDAAASLSGVGTISDAAMGLLVGAVASLSGSGSLSADISATVDAVASLSGSGSVVAALTAVSDIVASLTGSGSLTATPSALGQLSADITVAAVEDPLSPSSLAAAVWNALAAEFNTAGTMGEVLNSAGGGSSPSQVAAAVWAALRATNQDAGSMGEALVELFELMGLDPSKPLVVTPTTRDAGAAISQTIATVGTTTTVTRDP
jgi:hypothetical protein